MTKEKDKYKAKIRLEIEISILLQIEIDTGIEWKSTWLDRNHRAKFTAGIHRAKFPLSSPIDRARDSLIGNPKSEIAAPNSIEFYAGTGGCSAPPRILRGNWRLFRPYIKVAWYLQLVLTVINALRGWFVSALVAQKSKGAFNWT